MVNISLSVRPENRRHQCGLQGIDRFSLWAVYQERRKREQIEERKREETVQRRRPPRLARPKFNRLEPGQDELRRGERK